MPLARGSDLWLEPAQFEAARTDRQFHLYLVENIRQGDPGLFRLIDLHGEQLDRLLSRARERPTSPSLGPLPSTTPPSGRSRSLDPGRAGASRVFPFLVSSLVSVNLRLSR